MKVKALLLSLVLGTTLLAGCGSKEATTTTNNAKSTASTEQKADATSSASVVDTNEAFLKAISKDGNWIIATTKNLEFDQDLVLDGQFKNSRNEVQRKIALYTQDANKNVTARFELKAPRLIVKSENARIQGGTFKGDVYVEAKGFTVVDATVEGNVYFANEEVKAAYVPGENGKITGSSTEIKTAQ